MPGTEWFGFGEASFGALETDEFPPVSVRRASMQFTLC